MSDLRHAREQKGLSLDEVCRRTRIPVKWLDALERGDEAAFPPGPFLAGYTRQYRNYLGLPERPVVVEAPRPEPRLEAAAPAPRQEAAPRKEAPQPVATPRPVRVSPEDDLTEAIRRQPEERTETTSTLRRNTPRLLLVGGLSVLVLGLVVRAVATSFPDAAAALGVEPDQVVTLAIDDEMKVKVVADGRLVKEGTLAVSGADAYVFRAHDRLELSLPTLEGVRIRYNGDPLTPLGAQSRPRRLVFSDEPE